MRRRRVLGLSVLVLGLAAQTPVTAQVTAKPRRVVAVTGEPAADTEKNFPIGFDPFEFFIAQNGVVLFKSGLRSDPPDDQGDFLDLGYWFGMDRNSLSLLVRNGDGGIDLSVGPWASIDQSGNRAILRALVTGDFLTGLWIRDLADTEADLVLVTREGLEAAGISQSKFFDLAVNRSPFDGSGVLFMGQIDNSFPFNSDNDTGVWLYDPSGDSLIARENGIMPGLKATGSGGQAVDAKFNSFFGLTLTPDFPFGPFGTVGANSKLPPGGDGTLGLYTIALNLLPTFGNISDVTVNNTGIVVGSDVGFFAIDFNEGTTTVVINQSPVVSTGDASPDVEGNLDGPPFQTFHGFTLLDDGSVVLLAETSAGTGIWRETLDPVTREFVLKRVVQQGDVVPGAPGPSGLGAIRNVVSNNNGIIAFEARSGFLSGIWAVDANGNVASVLQPGDRLDIGDGGPSRGVSNVRGPIKNFLPDPVVFSTGADGYPTWLNDNDELLIKVEFDDFESGALVVMDLAQSVIVNSTGDRVDNNPGNKFCDTGQSIQRGANAEPECTLRAAIQEVNALGAGITIRFDIPVEDGGCELGGGCLIPVGSVTGQALPVTGVPVAIDGLSQPTELVDGPEIWLDGTLVAGPGLAIGGADSTVAGLLLRNFDGPGIALNSSGNTVTGSVFLDNGGSGVFVNNTALNTVGGPGSLGNVLFSNAVEANGANIRIEGADADNIQVIGNLVGLSSLPPPALAAAAAADGDEPQQENNPTFGILIIDGSTAVIEDNVIGDNSVGIGLQGGGSHSIEGNFIGILPDSVGPIPNDLAGVQVIGSEDNSIGGSTAAVGFFDGNSIVFNGTGIHLEDSDGTVVEGNLVGFNTGPGIEVRSSAEIRIGAVDPQAGNLITSNGADGVVAIDSLDVRVLSNSAVDNEGAGIRLVDTDLSTIGSLEDGTGNEILSNTSHGVEIIRGSGNKIFSNVINDNTGEGVVLRDTSLSELGGDEDNGNLINRNGLGGVAVSGGSDIEIVGNTIGDPDFANPGPGVLIQGSERTHVVDNHIRFHLGAGVIVEGDVTIEGGTKNDIFSNLITDNFEEGVLLKTTTAVRVGDEEGQGNVITQNVMEGVVVDRGADNRIQGNKIGVDGNLLPAPNTEAGVRVSGGARRTIIGSTELQGINIISFNGGSGIEILESNETDVIGNTIENNERHGIALDDAEKTDIGTDVAFSGNTLGKNSRFGVSIVGGKENTLRRNRIDTNGQGGVSIDDSSDNKLVDNGIFENDGVGVEVISGKGNSILGNDIWSNLKLGIDLDPQGVTANDHNDTDEGANGLQNFPVLLSADDDGSGEVTVTGFLSSAPIADYDIDFFGNSTCDPSGHGEGEEWWAFVVRTTDEDGLVLPFIVRLPIAGLAVPPLFVTATATATGQHRSTSEFSNCIPITPPPPPPGELDVAIVRNFNDPEILVMEEWLRQLSLRTQVFDQEGLTFAALADFDLIIWNDLGSAGGGLTDNDVNVFSQAMLAGIPLYFIGDDLAASASNLSGASATQWTTLLRLQGNDSAGGNGAVTIFNPGHPVTNGFLGMVEGFSYLTGDPDLALGTGTGEVLLAVSGADHVAVAYDGPAGRSVSQNVLLFNGLTTPARRQTEKLFKNAVLWLMPATFADSDGDGIPDNIEDAGPNGGDANDDGIADSQQANVASFPSSLDGEPVALTSPAGTTLSAVQPVANPSPADAPSGVAFPFGFFEFLLSGIGSGAATTVTLTLPDTASPDTYHKYGPTPDNPAPHWYEFLFDGTTGAQFVGGEVIVHFVDGQRGDSDLTANGEISDPGGPGLTLSEFLRFAQFGDGEGLLFSQILLFNPGAALTNVLIELAGDAGESIGVDLNQTQVVARTELKVPAGGLRSLRTDGLGGLTVGSVTVGSDQPLGGVILFGGVVGLAGVGDSRVLQGGFVAPIETNGTTNTGVAVMSVEDEEIVLNLTLIDQDGNAIATAQANLAAGGHVARFVNEFGWNTPPDFSSFRGILKVETTGRVAATVLQSRSGELATMPVATTADQALQALTASSGEENATPAQDEGELFFAQFGDGLGLLFSQIILINLDQDAAVNVRIQLRDDDGAPLSVDLNGQQVNGQLDVVVPAGGLRLLQTDGLGDLVVGSVSVTGDGPLAGVLLFGGSVGVAGVGASPELAGSFVAPMESNASEGSNMGIAVMNLEDKLVTVDLQLCDQEGNVIAEAQIELPPNGHRARFLDEFLWDTPVDFSDFKGTLKATVSGSVSATVLQTRPGQLATMPVVSN